MTISRPGVTRAAAVAALVLAACHAGGPTPRERAGTLVVVNTTATRAVVWVAQDSVHARMGTVEESATAELRVPPAFLEGRDSVAFLAFGADPECVQKARMQVPKRRRFKLVLKPEFPRVEGDSVLCRWK